MAMRQCGGVVALWGILVPALLALSMAAEPKVARQAYEKGLALFERYEHSAAIEAFSEAIRLDPRCAKAYLKRGIALGANDEDDRAIADFTEALRLDPHDAEAYLSRGCAYESKNQPDKAKADFTQAMAECDKAIGRDPRNVDAHIARGTAFYYRGVYALALADFDEAIRIAPTNSYAYHMRGNVHDRKSSNDPSERERNLAISDWKAAIRHDPKSIMSYQALGSAYASKGEHDKAILQYTEAIRLVPACDYNYCTRGVSYREKGDLDKAIADFNEAIRLCPKYAVAYKERGLAYAKKGDKAKAEAEAVRAKELGYKVVSADDQPNPDNQGFVVDRDADLPELQTYYQSGPDDVRDILVVEDGFLVATGAAVLQYHYCGDTVGVETVYTARNGLPSNNCYRLRRDADGGVWAYCQGGIGHLPAKAESWKAFSVQNGLASGAVTNLALSVDGKRIWVTSAGGLATALVRDCRWQAFPAKNLTDLMVHPTRDVVWCRKLEQSQCLCGRSIVSLQFDLQDRTWREIPDSRSCPAVAANAVHCDVGRGWLWMSRGDEPPLVHDLQKNTSRTWSREPRWERPKSEDVPGYSERFGEIVPTAGDYGGLWFATSAGLWHYDPRKDQWQGHLHKSTLGTAVALLVKSPDGNTLYWSCEGNVAAYDIRTDKWTDVWHSDLDPFGVGDSTLKLSPDGKNLWLIEFEGIAVGPVSNKKVTVLDDKIHSGLSHAKFVRFDSNKRLALIGTPQGVVCTDYSGTVRFVLVRPAAAAEVFSPVAKQVSREDDKKDRP